MCGSGTFLTEGGLDRGRCGAGARSRVFRLHRLARSRRRAVGAAARGGARAPRRAHAAALHLGFGHRCGCGAHGDRQRRARRRRRVGARREARARAMSPRRGPSRAGRWRIRPTASASARSRVCPRCTANSARVLRERFQGWQAAILTGNPPLARNLGVYAKRTHRVFNGTIECRLLRFDLNEASAQRPAEEVRADWSSRPGAQMFANRLRKNLQRLEPWAEREHIDCFRVYDADMPEYAFAIDLYGREPRHVYVQEYAAPKTVESGERARAPPRGRWRCCRRCCRCRWRTCTRGCANRRRAPSSTKSATTRPSATRCRKAGSKFWVNFRDYLDTGLFLDHRIVRGDAARLGQGRRFPEFVLLHRQRHGVRRGRRRAQQRERRSVQHLSRLGARQSAVERLRRSRARTVPRGLPAMAGEPGAVGAALRFDFRRSADLLQFQAHGGRARRAARSCRHDPPLA